MSRKNLLIALAIGMAVSARGVAAAAAVFFPACKPVAVCQQVQPVPVPVCQPVKAVPAAVRSRPARSVRHASHFAARKHRPLQHVKYSSVASLGAPLPHVCGSASGPQPLKASGQPSPAPAPLPPAPPAASGT